MKKRIDESLLPKYGPELVVTKRLFAYLENIEAKTPGVYIPKDLLFEKGILAGFSKPDLKAGINELERITNCTAFWDGENKTMVYRVFPMTPEQKIKVIDDAVWFESL